MAEPNQVLLTPKRSGVCVALGLVGLTVACGGGLTQPSAVPTPAPTPTPPPRAAIISVDGLRPDALTFDTAPNILALAQRGAYTWTAQTVYPSTTLPSHASMLTGVEPGSHGITFDEYRDSFLLKTPTVLQLARAAGKRTVMVVGKAKFKQLALAGSLDVYVQTARGDADVVNEAVAQLPTGFDLLFVHLPQTDQVGHASGWMSAAYVEQLQATDAAIGRLVSLLPQGTTVVLTADHGGQLKDHGSRDKVDMTIPWIIAGPRVARAGQLTQPVRTVDTALTVLSLLGVPAPPNVTGKLVSEPFGPS
jgi:predicted AlkP superfamily pyrophosphatase or phosphodiesterase